jgi:hypothetical protein
MAEKIGKLCFYLTFVLTVDTILYICSFKNQTNVSFPKVKEYSSLRLLQKSMFVDDDILVSPCSTPVGEISSVYPENRYWR